MKVKLFAIHLFFIVISFGIKYYHLQGPNLIWNMILALIALDFAYLTSLFKKKILIGLFALAWFFFYPNTFYMLTDIIHMHFVGDVLYNKTNLILYILYVSSILFGFLSGIESFSVIMRKFRISNIFLRWGIIGIVSFVSSFGIHIGRYARLNSWDILTKPQVVINELLAVPSRDSFHFILGFTFLQVLCLIFMDYSAGKKLEK
ncbi:TPA: DUF1361 domain-containing protein [Streptococcus agalactiae]